MTTGRCPSLSRALIVKSGARHGSPPKVEVADFEPVEVVGEQESKGPPTIASDEILEVDEDGKVSVVKEDR